MDAPHPSYLLTLVAGEFDEIEETPADSAGAKGARRRARAVPLSYLVPRGAWRTGCARSRARRRWSSTSATLTGMPYPWNKYAQVVVSDFIFGGMENTTATTMYEHILLDARAAIDVTSDDLIAHELAHQWFGDYVTCRDWSEGWLNEGFATFFEHVWREKRLGRDEYDFGLKGDLEAYLAEATGATAARSSARTTTRRSICSIATSTRRAALVLHALRVELGDDALLEGHRASI